jgi:hypothetical protein
MNYLIFCEQFPNGAVLTAAEFNLLKSTLEPYAYWIDVSNLCLEELEMLKNELF